jgi:aryl-alcohol dehydrogenase
MTTTTTAAVLRQRGGPYSLETLELADPGPGQLLVRLAACGICFTDVGVQRYEQGTPLPQVLGHEGAGTVVAVGDGVNHVAPGDRVVLSYASCGACSNCSHDHPQYCSNFMMLNYAGMLSDGRAPFTLAGAPVFGGFFGRPIDREHSVVQELLTAGHLAECVDDRFGFGGEGNFDQRIAEISIELADRARTIIRPLFECVF